MNILLIGGTGNVGRTAVTRLVNNGHTVRVIGRRSGVTLEGAETLVSIDKARALTGYEPEYPTRPRIESVQAR
jgi:nucleoside-diphosphate-sugar epimerase